MRKFDVLCAGQMVNDVIATNVQRSFFDADTSYSTNTRYSTGGDALNVAVNLAKLGAKVRMAGCVGRDPAGAGLLRELQECGIEGDLVLELDDVASGTSMILCEPGGERHILYYPGANDRFDGAAITDDALRETAVLYVGSVMGLPALEDGCLAPLFERAQRLGVKTVTDACGPRAPYDFEMLRPALRYTDVFIPSYEEAVMLTGRTDPAEAAQFFMDCGVKLAGVKLGSKGVYIADGVQSWQVPAIFCANPVDTTGAGDAFMAGFVRGLTLGLGYAGCARMGCAMGYSCVQSVGAATHDCSMDSIRGILEKNK